MAGLGTAQCAAFERIGRSFVIGMDFGDRTAPCAWLDAHGAVRAAAAGSFIYGIARDAAEVVRLVRLGHFGRPLRQH